MQDRIRPQPFVSLIVLFSFSVVCEIGVYVDGSLHFTHNMPTFFFFSLMNSVSDPKEDETPTSLLLMASSCVSI